MKTIQIAVTAGTLALALAGPVLALDDGNQSATKPTQRIIEQVPAVSNEETGAIDPVVLQPGKNSFTEGQAKARIEGAGFTNVGALTLDQQGIWRGKASKGAMSVDVGLDFKGNIASRNSKAQ